MPRGLTILGVLAGVLALGFQAVGLGQTTPPAAKRVIEAGGVTAVDAGFDPAALRSRRTAAIELAGAQSAGNPRYVSGEVIARFTPGAAPERLAGRLLELGVRRAAPRPDAAGFDLLELVPGADPEAVAQALAALPDVEFAQPSYLRRPLFVPNDPYFAEQWNLAILNMTQAWDINRGAGETVIAAVIDTGVALFDGHIEFEASAFTLDDVWEYPALGALRIPFAAAPDLAGPDRFVAPWDFIWEDDTPVDLEGHGTHVAGAIGQLTDNGIGAAGMAFNVRIMPLKVLANEWDLIFGALDGDECCGASDADVARAIRYAVDNGARVINLSLGGEEESPVIDDAVRDAVERGAFVAMAAGNEFMDGNPPSHPAASSAAIDGAMAVGAVDQSLRRAEYSNTGSYVEIAAPGGYRSRDGTYDGGLVLQQRISRRAALTFLLPPAFFGPPRFDELVIAGAQGTSFATPHVTGLAALLMTQGITDPAVIEAAIKYFAVDLGPAGRDDEFGYGLINPHATLRGFGLNR
ncbi:MAG: S8 family serine peptidase [Acidobacteria bacterium]|nr:S8 family serine peptidase [Acidobacteriota bacterium]